MKKTFRFPYRLRQFAFIIAGLALLASCNHNGTSSSSDSNFEGVVNYGIILDSGLPPEIVNVLKDVTMKTYIKGNMTRSEEEIAGNRNIIIADSKKPGDPVMLVSMYGHKYAVRLNDSLKKLEEKTSPKIDYIDSAGATKQIAGYSCKKAKITISLPPNDTTITSYMYYTTDLPYADPQGQFKGLKGMPMEFVVNMSGLKLTISAKSVDKVSLPDSLFVIPSGYKEMNVDEIKKELMKNMGSDSTAAPQQ